jgi:hypothetical protein
MADITQSPSQEANWLRENWNMETLGQYKGQWIAVLSDQIIEHSSSLDEILSQTIGRNPLYAFVYFEPLQ